MPGVEVLVVHGAPVTDAVLDASSVLRLVCCARGGPVNIDVEAVTAQGLPLVNTPGKNAEAVADLTLAFLVMLARGLPKAQRFLAEGHQLRRQLGRRTVHRKRPASPCPGTRRLRSDRSPGRAAGARVRTCRPGRTTRTCAVDDAATEQVETLDELLFRSDFVSLHARATPENENMIDAVALGGMKPGAFLINTARETLVDEDALDAALSSGRLGGAALDVVRTTEEPGRHPLLRHENVVLTPHLGGATHETLLQGAEMIAEEITGSRLTSHSSTSSTVPLSPHDRRAAARDRRRHGQLPGRRVHARRGAARRLASGSTRILSFPVSPARRCSTPRRTGG